MSIQILRENRVDLIDQRQLIEKGENGKLLEPSDLLEATEEFKPLVRVIRYKFVKVD
jgi:hypothetical protein